MRIVLNLFVFCALFLAAPAKAQNPGIIIVEGDTVDLAKDTLVRNKLLQLDLRRYEGKTVAEFLNNDTVKRYKKYWFSDEPPFKLHSFNLSFARGLYLIITFDELKYQPRFSATGKFSFDKILKETISTIRLDREFFEENVVKRYSMQE